MTITDRKGRIMESKELLMEKIENFAKEREDIERSIDALQISAYAEVCKIEIVIC